MPKEVVYGSDVPFGTPEEPGLGRSIVEVRWAHEPEGGEYVSIVSKCVSAHKPGDETVTSPPVIDYTDGYHVQLDRRGINALIRNLRRARDRSFGRDE